jgi:uncharacterized protein with gpF-like domain
LAIPGKIIVDASKVSPEEAIKIFDKQGIKISKTAEETRKAVEEKVFAITQDVQMSVVQDVRDALSKALKDGQTFETFQKDIKNTLAKKGWTGERTAIIGGEEVQVLTTPHRLKTIYRTNIQSALNAGRFERQVDNASDRPFLMLIDGIVEKSRSSHKKQSGSIQPITSSFWKAPNSWYPPNGFNCTGRTRALTRAQAKSRGIKINNRALKPDPGFGSNPATQFFKPEKEDFDTDIWEAGQDLEPSTLK